MVFVPLALSDITVMEQLLALHVPLVLMVPNALNVIPLLVHAPNVLLDHK